MVVDDPLVLRLAKLAKLDLPPAKRDGIRKDLEHILRMVATLDGLELDDVEPLRYVTATDQSLRPDRVGPMLDRALALEQAADHDGAFFRVPRV